MGITVASEVRVFAASFLCGILSGVLFDVFRALRKKVRSGTALVALEDLLFWLALAGLVFAFLYRINNGQPRWFIFVGIVLGAVLYQLTVSRYVVVIFTKFIGFICAVFGFLRKILLFPFRILKKPLRILVIPLSKLNKKITHTLCKMKNDLKKIKKVAKMY